MGTIRVSRFAAACIIATLLVGIVPSAASAAGLAAKQVQAARVKKQIDALDTKLEVASEDYNRESDKFAALQTKIWHNQRTLRDLNRHIDALHVSLDARAVGMYRSGPISSIEVLLGAESFEDMATRWDLLDKWNEQQAAKLTDLGETVDTAERVQRNLRGLRRDELATLKSMKSRKRYIVAELGTRKKMLSGIESEIAALEAAQIAAQARARGYSAASWGDYGTPTNAPHPEIVDIAKRYLGRPYVWAATGPDTFDCSGLAMFCYAKIGISLPHYSGAQIGMGQRVSRANLQPGDLVFYGHPIHHVGIYAGNGQMIDAPHSGSVVRYDSIWGNYAGACRP